MEETHTHEPIQPEPAVSFPDPRPQREQNGFPKWIFAVIGLVIILAGGGFFLYQSSTSPVVSSPTPTPFVSGLDTLPTPTDQPTATPTATPSSTPTTTQKAGISVEVQNGTGTTGDAALAKSILDKAGYTNVKTGNAASQSATETTVIYSSDISLSVVSEITNALSATFSPVKSQSGSGKMTITVITGPKGATSTKATASPTPKASATPTASPKATATPTP